MCFSFSCQFVVFCRFSTGFVVFDFFDVFKCITSRGGWRSLGDSLVVSHCSLGDCHMFLQSVSGFILICVMTTSYEVHFIVLACKPRAIDVLTPNSSGGRPKMQRVSEVV